MNKISGHVIWDKFDKDFEIQLHENTTNEEVIKAFEDVAKNIITMKMIHSDDRFPKYAIGNGEHAEGFRMWYGPVVSLSKCLTQTNSHYANQFSRILRFNKDNTHDILYRWSKIGMKWVEIDGK
jgi:hypothetical protein